MKVTESSLSGVQIIDTCSNFIDYRGKYAEIYNKQFYAGLAAPEFVQDDISISSKHVLRGIHGDDGTWKLISCLSGKFYLVVVNYHKESPQFGKYETFTLSGEDTLQILVPAGFGNGHLVLEDNTIFHYKQSTYYGDYKQFTVTWNDRYLHIPWPIDNPITKLFYKIGS